MTDRLLTVLRKIQRNNPTYGQHFTNLISEAIKLAEELEPLAHSCEMLGRASPMGEGRDWWLGRLMEPLADYPQETHCLHMTTPLKTVVFALTVADLDILTALFYVGKRRHTDPGWVELRAQAFSAADQPEEKGND